MSERRSAVERPLLVWRVLGALFLLAMGGIHLFLVFDGTGGLLGVLFVVNAVGAFALAWWLVVTRLRLVLVRALSLLWVVGTLVALVVALSPLTLFGMRSSLDYRLAPTSLVVEAIGSVVLAVTAVLAARSRS